MQDEFEYQINDLKQQIEIKEKETSEARDELF